jgi:Cu-Zn family superoxide dismutase
VRLTYPEQTTMQSHLAFILVVWSLALTACGDAGRRDRATNDKPGAAVDSPAADTAAGNITAQVRNSSGKELGTLTLTDAGQGISVAGRLTGLPPGEHGIHLHQTGRCDPPAFGSAGDHWNPTNTTHGTKSPNGPHLGDLLNLTVSRDSSVTVQATTPGGTLRGANALLDQDGAAVVVHAKRDDYRSQPAGDSGDKIACGAVNGRR